MFFRIIFLILYFANYLQQPGLSSVVGVMMLQCTHRGAAALTADDIIIWIDSFLEPAPSGH